MARASARSSLDRNGLTLIELTMVLLIMGILTAVAAPRLTSQLNQHSVGSIRSLIETDLKAAQQEALTTSSSVTFSIDRLRNLYSITARRGGTATVLKTIRIGADPWNSQITSLLRGSTKQSVDTMTLTINGGEVSVDVDGAPVLSGDFGSVLAGSIGFEAVRTGATIDDFQVEGEP